MAKFYGPVGYFQTKAELLADGSPTGIYSGTITQRYYYGDILKLTKRYQSADKVNDDLNITNQISILADPFATQNLGSIRYVTYLGTKWKVTDVEVQFPRLVLSLGGVYNGQ